MVYDFSWSIINAATSHPPPQDSKHFSNNLHHTLKIILHANPALGLVCLSKVDLANVYVWLWVRMEDVPLVALLIPKKNSTDPQPFDFHLSLLMGYINSTA